jgi:hypothetical protein
MKVARLSVITASLLGAMKLTAASMTGSMAIAGSFVDSLTDVFASSVNLVAIRIGSRPADDDHRFGHGKAEGLAGMFQGAVIGFSGFFLVTESVRRLLEHRTAEREMTGVIVMAIACVASVWITCSCAARRGHRPVALPSRSAHYASDVHERACSCRSSRALHALGGSIPWSACQAAIVLGSFLDRPPRVHGRADGPGPGRARRGDPRAVLAGARGARRALDPHLSVGRALVTHGGVRLHLFAGGAPPPSARTAVLTAVPDADVSVHADPDPLLPDDHPR